MADARALLVLLSGSPAAPGARDVLGRAGGERRGGREVRVLLTADGLTWAGDPLLRDLMRAGADVSLCSRSARDQGWTAASTPDHVRWSSVASFLQGHVSHDLWTVLP